MKDKYTRAVAEVATKLADARNKLPSGQHKLFLGKLDEIEDEVINSYGLLGMVNKQKLHETARKRVHRRSLTKHTYGPVLPLALMEPILLVHTIYRQEAGQALTPSEGLELARSILEGSELLKDLKKFRNNIRKNPECELSKGWWNNFMKRNDHHLKSVRGYRMTTARMKDSTYNNCEVMYDLIYKHMIDSRIAGICRRMSITG